MNTLPHHDNTNPNRMNSNRMNPNRMNSNRMNSNRMNSNRMNSNTTNPPVHQHQTHHFNQTGYDSPNLVNDKYGFDIDRLRDLIIMIATYGNGAGDNKLYRRATQNGYSNDEINHAQLLCDSLFITAGNLELSSLRTGNLDSKYMPTPFARAVGNIMVEEQFITIKPIDERVIWETPYAIQDLVYQAMNERDTSILITQTNADKTIDSDLINKVIDICNYLLSYSGVSTLHNMTAYNSIASMSDRKHQQPLSIASIHIIVNHCCSY